jgi:glycosyltransferase involved in cell wall biosynthesis
MPATEATPELTVIVPVFRNAACIAELSARLERALSPRRYELLFVDDASPDGADAVIRRLVAHDSRVGGVLLPENVGQNRAVLVGLARARGNAVAVMDGDLQDPPEALPMLLEALARDDTDVVYAARRGRYEPATRLAAGRLLKWTLWALSTGKVPRDAGLFLVMRRPVVERVVATAGADPYILVSVARAARSAGAVEVERARARETSYTSGMRWRVAYRALVAAVRR